LCVLLCVCWQRRDEGNDDGWMGKGGGWLARVGIAADAAGNAGSFVHMDRARSAPRAWPTYPWTGSTSRGFGLGNHAGQGRRPCGTAAATAVGDLVPWWVKLAWSGNGTALLGPLNFGFPEASNKNPTWWRSTTVQRRCRLPLTFAGYEHFP
jgi:hypothetical protein